MSRRILQTLQRPLKAGRVPLLRSQRPLYARRILSRTPVSTVGARCYATENPKGVPLPSANEAEEFTPAEKERTALHEQAQ
jgi:hypothetical protein